MDSLQLWTHMFLVFGLIIMDLITLCIGSHACSGYFSNCVQPDNTSVFVCPSRGRFPNSEKDWMFYKCPSKEEFACVCQCPKGKMFDVKTLACQRRWNNKDFKDKIDIRKPDKHSKDYQDNVSHIKINNNDPYNRMTDKDHSQNLYQKTNKVLLQATLGSKEHLQNSQTRKTISTTTSDDAHILLTSRNGYIKHNQHESQDITTQQNSEKTDIKSQDNLPKTLSYTGGRQMAHHTFIIEDNSLFPDWAIAFVVLCIVIALVLVVLVMY